MKSFDLKCNVETYNWTVVGEIEFCMAQNVNITTINEEVTSMNGRTEPRNLQGFMFREQTL